MDSRFETVVIFHIYLIAFLVGQELTYQKTASAQTMDIFRALNLECAIVFFAEMVIKIFAEGRQPWRYWQSRWNCFDSFLLNVTFFAYLFGDRT